MKKKIYLYCLGAAAVSCLLAVSCSKEETQVVVYGPTLTVSAASVVASADGASYSFTYTVANPADDGAVACSADADWITDLDSSTYGYVSFSLSENATTALRYGNITVSYTSSDGKASATVLVAQNSAYAPVLTVEPVTFTLSGEGGSCEVAYSVENPGDGSLSCSADADWIGGFDTSADGVVAFTVDANTGSELRSGVVTLTFTASTGIAEANVLVAQSPAEAPVLTADQLSVAAPGEGADFSFTYAVANPASDGTVSCTADADWITGIDTSNDGSVSYTVEANDGVSTRTGVLTLTYSSSFGQSVASVVVSQTVKGTPYLTFGGALMNVSVDGGSYSASYVLTNASEDGSLSCTTEASWITGVDTSTDGTVSFTVSANDGSDGRTGIVTLTYTSSLGETSASIVVAQGATETTVPVVVLDPATFVVDSDGGSGFVVSFNVENPKDGGSMSINYSATWTNNFDTSNWLSNDSGSIGFDVSLNASASLRSSYLTFTYTYQEGSTAMSAVSHLVIVQRHGVDLSGNFVGTYTCTGKSYNVDYDGVTDTNWAMDNTWTMKIYADGSGGLILDGLAPDSVDYYPNAPYYIARASISGDDILVYPQFTGYMTSVNGVYMNICWALSTGYSDTGWNAQSTTSTPCTFTKTGDDTWTSDYGMMLGLSTTTSISGLTTFYDVFAPGLVITRTSASTSSVSTSYASVPAVGENHVLRDNVVMVK